MLKKVSFTPTTKKIIVLILAAIFSMTLLTRVIATPAFFASSIEKLDEKKEEALVLTTAVALSSTLVTALPDDIGSPIADELSELTTVLMVIVCVIFFEKYLLVILAFLAFFGIIPAACILGVVNTIKKTAENTKWINKLIALALVFVMVIPVSVKIISVVDETYAETFDQTLERVKAFSSEAENMVGDEDSSFLTVLSNVGKGVSNLAQNAKDILNLLLDAIGVLLITVCFIPVLTIVLLLWSMKLMK